MCIDYKDSSEHLSQFMRIAHARFGTQFNKLRQSSGKVANERPKTPLIEDPNHNIRVHLYIEANPIRAKIISLEKLRFYKYSSYGFYAHGIKTKWTELLTIPEWYLELGKTPKERQARYRKLFREYIESDEKVELISTQFIGSLLWKEKMKIIVYEKVRQRSSDQKAQSP